jgi:hypothetical protein
MAKLSLAEGVLFFIFKYILSVFGYIISAPFRILYEFFTIHHPGFYRAKNTPSNHVRKVRDVQDQV